jgi:hypothetical protein
MKSKYLIFLLVITSLFGYLEWGGGSHAFLFQGEAEMLYNIFTNPDSVFHPFVMLPLFGQILLLITLFQKSPNKLFIYLGIIGLGVLLGFMFIIGIISLNFKITFSTIPFLFISILTIINLRKSKST